MIRFVSNHMTKSFDFDLEILESKSKDSIFLEFDFNLIKNFLFQRLNLAPKIKLDLKLIFFLTL